MKARARTANDGNGERRARNGAEQHRLQKTPTGIDGFDEVTDGGLPRGRPTLICGAAGCGKTLFGVQFLVRGAVDYGEPGVFLAFEETEKDLVENSASLGFDLVALQKKKLLELDHIRIERSEIEETGEYDLEGLFLRLDAAISAIGAKRVVIDTLETIFGGLSNHSVLRSELLRLFRWLKEKGVTTVVTAERGDGALTRHGLEEYVSDCVIVLDHRVHDQISTRRVRIVKYRGSTHGTNEYPFLISSTGISVVPITSTGLHHVVSNQRITSGIPKLDRMLGGAGYFRGSTILVSGTAGSGKTSLCAHLAEATCRAGGRCVYVSYEESPAQIARNMGSIGLHLRDWMDRGLLRIESLRATAHGLEGHLGVVHELVRDFKPSVFIIDPIGTLSGAGELQDSHLLSVRIIDFLKSQGITVLLSNLTHGGDAMEATSLAVSSLVDTWLLVRALETNGERNRTLYVLKSRGMAHSNQVREFLITENGIDLVEPYIGAEGVLTGTARTVREEEERASRQARMRERERTERVLVQKRALLEQRIAALQAEFTAESFEIERTLADSQASEEAVAAARTLMSRVRGETQQPSRKRQSGASDRSRKKSIAPRQASRQED